MTRLSGPIMQNGYVVRDLDAAMAHWTGVLGVGPFFVTPRVPFAELTYRGAPSGAEIAVAVAFSGELQIELVRQTNDAASVYRDHLAAHGEGLHHVGILSERFDQDMAHAEAAGIGVAQAGRTASGLRFAYLDTERGHSGSMIELIECTPGMRRFLDRLKAAAQDWDGSDPVRLL